MKLEELMQKKVVTIEMDCPLKEVKEIFENTRFHHLLITESNKLVGIISDRDYLKAVSPKIGTAAETQKDSATLNKRVHLIMSRNLHTLSKNNTVSDAIALFNHQNISCIPIIDESRKIQGIISWRDIMKLMYQKLLQKKQQQK